MIIVAIVLGLLAWMAIGACVLAANDNEQRDLYHWYISAPMPVLVCPLVLLLWPLVLYVAKREPKP